MEQKTKTVNVNMELMVACFQLIDMGLRGGAYNADNVTAVSQVLSNIKEIVEAENKTELTSND